MGSNKHIWYPFDDTECAGKNFPKDVFLDARILSIKFDTFILNRVERNGNIVTFTFNNDLTLSCIAEKKERYIKKDFTIAYAIFKVYNTDIQSYNNLNLPFLPTLVLNIKEHITTKLTFYTIKQIYSDGTVEYDSHTYQKPVTLKAGYNCLMFYNKLQNILYINPVKGAGEGEPPEDYYKDYITCNKGILKINGNILQQGKLNIRGENGVEVYKESDKIIIELKETVVKKK